MTNNDDYLQIAFDNLDNIDPTDYADDNIVFKKGIRELPFEGTFLKVDMYAILVCINGKIRVETNNMEYTLHKQEVIIIRPQTYINDYMISPDFYGAVLCMTPSGLLQYVAESEVWEKAFRIMKNPIVKISEESMKLLMLYGNILTVKIVRKDSSYRKEIISNTIKTVLYELLSNITGSDSKEYDGSNLVKQRDVLFKRFIELLNNSSVKPRLVAWYADQLCVSPKYLSSVCKETSGKTAFDWITKYVLTDIQNMLKYSNKSIKEISESIDFPNISCFGKYCRKHFGVSPTAYREQLRKPQ